MSEKYNCKLIKMGNQIRRARIVRRLNQETLAEKAGLSKNYVGSIERGGATPSLATLAAIAEALSVNINYFIEVCDTQNRDEECERYENQIMEAVKSLDKQQLLSVLDYIEILQKYSKAEEL